MKYKAIMIGMFGVMSVNRNFRTLTDKCNELEARLDAIDGGVVETVADEAAQPVDAEPEQTETVADEKDQPFDWKTSDDAAALKAFALDQFGLGIKGNKKADTIRKEIEGFLESQGV